LDLEEMLGKALAVISAAALAGLLALPVSESRADQSSPLPAEQQGASIDVLVQNADGKGVRLAIPKKSLDQTDYHRKNLRSFRVAVESVRMPRPKPLNPTAAKIFQEIERKLQQSEDTSAPAVAGESGSPAAPGSESELEDGPLIVEISGAFVGSPNPLIEYAIEKSTVGRDDSDPDFHRYSIENGASTIGMEVLVPRDDVEARRVKIVCMVAATMPDAESCTFYISVGDRLGLEYMIPRREMTNWRTVDARVTTWIDAITMECFEGPRLQAGSKPDEYYPCPF